MTVSDIEDINNHTSNPELFEIYSQIPAGLICNPVLSSFRRHLSLPKSIPSDRE